MWVHEHVGETEAEPSQVWRVLADLDHWADWDTSMEWVRVEGPVEPGTTVIMKPIGQDEIASTITAVEEDRHYADRTEFGGVVLDFSHTLEQRPGGGTRVLHRLEISGSQADTIGPEIGPMITEDFPDAMAALVGRAVALRTPTA